jgi:hypothetical protein
MLKFQFIALLAATGVLAQSPLLHHTSPLAVPAGRASDLTLMGERLREITDVWTSLADAKVVHSNGSTITITTPETAAGIAALRVATTNGASELTMFMIDDLPSAIETGTNRSIATAHHLRQPVAVDATTGELAFDYYSFEAKKGETVSLDVVASRIGSKLDPVLRILDRQGHEVAFCEDAPGAVRDCRIQFRAPNTGQYLIELRDISYQGGPQYFYRLRLGKFAFATCTYPLTAPSGSDVIVLGPAGEQFKSGKFKMSAAAYAALGNAFVPARGCDPAGAEQVFEKEPNDKREQANQISVPGVVNGRFEKPNDRDWFQFKVEKDQRWVFAAGTRSLGSPCDVFLEVRDTNGKVIASSNPVGPQDTSLTHQFKESGQYLLIAKELADRGAPDLAYQIEAKQFEPRFEIAVDDDKIEGKAGGEASLAVSCTRSDFSDKITVEFEGLPDGFTVEGTTMEAKKTNTTVKIKVPESATPGKLLKLSVFGSSGDKRVKAGTIFALRKQFPLLLYPPPELDGVVTVGITAQPPAPEPKRKRT